MSNEASGIHDAPARTAGEAGWHVSRYNLSAPIPNTKMTAMLALHARIEKEASSQQ